MLHLYSSLNLIYNILKRTCVCPLSILLVIWLFYSDMFLLNDITSMSFCLAGMYKTESINYRNWSFLNYWNWIKPVNIEKPHICQHLLSTILKFHVELTVYFPAKVSEQLFSNLAVHQLHLSSIWNIMPESDPKISVFWNGSQASVSLNTNKINVE